MILYGKRNSIAFITAIWLLVTCDAQATDTNKAVCVTDKETYQQGEDVVVTITNDSTDAMTIVDRQYIDGSFATIEIKHNDGTWQPIELYVAANITSLRSLERGKSHRYIWKTVGYNRMDTVAASGTYKIIFHNGIISNQFLIVEETRSH